MRVSGWGKSGRATVAISLLHRAAGPSVVNEMRPLTSGAHLCTMVLSGARYSRPSIPQGHFPRRPLFLGVKGAVLQTSALTPKGSGTSLQNEGPKRPLELFSGGGQEGAARVRNARPNFKLFMRFAKRLGRWNCNLTN